MRFAIAAIITLLLISGCAPSEEDKQLKIFQDACIGSGNAWHRMAPTVDGEFIDGDPCFGCMVGDTHYCDFKEFATDMGLNKA